MSKITELTKLWMEVIRGLHHKDRDCHFGIEKAWSYGEHPVYRVNHYGCLMDEDMVDFSCYEDAENQLRVLIKNGIMEWMDSEDCALPFDRKREINEEIRNL